MTGLKKYLDSRTIAVLFITAAVAVALSVTEIIKNLPSLAFIIGGTVFIVAGLIVNAIAAARLYKRFKTIGAASIMKELLDARAEKEAGYLKYRRVLKLLVSLLNIYLLLLWIAAIAAAAGSIALALTNGIWWISVFAYYIISIAILRFILPYTQSKKQIKREALPYALTEKDFPLLNKAAAEAARILGIDKKISLYFYFENNVSISETGDSYRISIGINVVPLLSGKEFTSVMLHELAHARNGDLGLTGMLQRLMPMTQDGGKKFSVHKLFAFALASYIGGYSEMTLYAHSKLCEEKADAAVKSTAYAVDYINASAKIHMLSDLYAFTLAAENILEKELPPENYSEYLFGLFMKDYEAHGEIWRKNCLNNLAPRYDSHPSFGERMKNLGVTDFAVSFMQTEEEAGEAKKCFDLADTVMLPEISQQWREARENNYLPCVKTAEAYENREDEPDEAALQGVAEAYITLCRHDECLGVLDKMLAKNPDNAYALLKKAIILASRWEDGCRELFLAAMERYLPYYETASLWMKHYILHGGDRGKYEELFDWWDTKAGEAFDLQRFYAYARPRDLAPCDLDGETVKRLSASLQKTGAAGCLITKTRTLKKPVYLVFINAAEKENDCFEKADAILNAEKECFILCPFSNVSEKFYPKLLKTAIKAGAKFLFTSQRARVTEKNYLNKSIKKRVNRRKYESVSLKLRIAFLCVVLSEFLIALTVSSLPPLKNNGIDYLATMTVLLLLPTLIVFASIMTSQQKKFIRKITLEGLNEEFEFNANLTRDKELAVEAYLLANGYAYAGRLKGETRFSPDDIRYTQSGNESPPMNESNDAPADKKSPLAFSCQKTACLLNLNIMATDKEIVKVSYSLGGVPAGITGTMITTLSYEIIFFQRSAGMVLEILGAPEEMKI